MTPFKKYALALGALFCLLPVLCSAQTADFTASAVSGCAPLQVSFTNTSSGATSSSWNLGNGNTSTLTDAAATYQAGTFTVTLSINGGASSKNMTITVYDKPAIQFSSNKVDGCSPLTVNFSNSSTPGTGSTSLTYNWVFGDGGTSTLASPDYTYQSPSEYSVTLMATNEHGCSNAVVGSQAINVKGPLVNFNSPQTSFCLTPANVTFNNTTTGKAPLSYQWNFGDQSPVVTQASPSHPYITTGSFDVTLTATDGDGCVASNKKTGFISVGNEPGVTFTASPEKICVGQKITINNQTSVPVTSQLWDFGNGSQSSDVTPAPYSYSQAGFYNITLKSMLPSGCEVSVVKRIEVVFDAVANFSSAEACGRKITFTNTSQFATSFSWDFGDQTSSLENSPMHTYASSGTYQVKLTAYNGLNCSTFIEKLITVNSNPVAGILPNKENSCTEPSLSGCAPFAIQFTNGTSTSLPLNSIAWTFGDTHDNTSTASSPSHTYQGAGSYNVTLVVTNSIGCKDTARAVVKVSATAPKADFSVNKTNVCVNEKVTFNNLSTSSTFWCWDFGDNSGSSEKAPEHVYKKPGVYTVALTSKNGGCSDAITKTQLITVKDPYLDFAVVKNCGTPYDITLINNSQSFNEFTWNFGDGTPVNTQTSNNVPHHYQATGTYNVKLTIKSQTTGCVVKDSTNVIIQEIKADFVSASNPVCKNNPVAFNSDQSKFAVGWAWDFKDGTPISQLHNPVKAFTTPGDYNVTLTVTDSDHCSDSKVVPIKVANIQGAFSITAASDCNDFTVNFKDKSIASPAINNWLWDFGNGVSSTDQNPQNIYHQQGSYAVRLTLQNVDATCSILLSDAVVFTNPVPDFTAPKTSICVNEAITFQNKSTLANTFSWDLGNNQTKTDATPTTVYASPGKYTVTLKAKDQYGCEKSIVKTNFLEVLQPVADFDASQTSAECPPLITTFKNKSSSDVTKWSWSFGDGQTSVLQNPVNTYQIPGLYDVTLEVTNFAGCSAKRKVEGLVSLGGPYGKFDITSLYTCVNDAVSFLATATNTAKYIWDFGDGTVLDTDQNQVTHTYTNVAVANLSLTLVDNKGCKVVVDKGKKVDVKPKPEIDFDFDPEYPFEKENVVFTASLKDQLDLVWKFDNDDVPGEAVIEHAFDVYGVHHVVLSGTDTEGCAGMAEKDILVQADIKMIPNVFTPNDDNYNSTFWVEDIEKGFWELRVYNRWGQQVFKGEDYINDWDGKGLSAGVYYYAIRNRYRPSVDYKGYVQIIR